MSGNYPDAPGNRIPYDIDGTVGVAINSSNIITQLTQTQLNALNDESDTTSVTPSTASGSFALLFSSPQTINGTWISCVNNGITMSYSLDTTTGVDGTWSAIPGWTWSAINNQPTSPNYRSVNTFTPISDVVGLKLGHGSSNPLNTFHVYGYNTNTLDKLEFWHPTLDQPLYQTPALLDFGDIPRSATYTKTVRLKNLSSTLTASGITVSLTALTDSGHLAEMSLLYDSGSYATTATCEDLAPGAISASLFTVKFAPTSTSALSVWNQRLLATATSWS